MRYCATCDAEYRSGRDRCLECDVPLLDQEAYEAELTRQGRRPLDFRSLVAVAVLADRFEAEELAHALAGDAFHPSIVSSRAEIIGSPGLSFSVVVPESEGERATSLCVEWHEALVKARAESEQAAEAAEAPSASA